MKGDARIRHAAAALVNAWREYTADQNAVNPHDSRRFEDAMGELEAAVVATWPEEVRVDLF